MNAPEMDPVTAELDMALRELASLGGDLLDHANRLGRILFSPPRVVIVGRLKAGKSTLVNALVGDDVAATGALEVTNAVTVFHNGAPSRAEVVDRGGNRHAVQNASGVVTTLPVPLSEVAYIDRFLPSRAIADVTLIDTPGLATLTAENEEVAKRALLPGYDQTRVASAEADAAVFVFESLPRAHEREFVSRLGFTPLNVVGVLARADGFGEGAMGERDPLEHAREYAVTLSTRMEDLVSTVVPVAGILAESARTGRVSEQVARRLARLGGLAREDALVELESTGDTEVFTAAERREVLDLLGEYGTLEGASRAGRGAAALSGWLDASSGVDALDRYLRGELLPFAAMQRALRITGELEQLAIHHPARERVRHILGVLFGRPAMAKVVLFRSYRGLVATSPQSPLTAMTRRALASGAPAEAVGLAPDAGAEEIDAAARDVFGRIQQMQLIGISAAEDDARANLGRYLYSLGLGR